MADIERYRGDTDSLFVTISDSRNNPVDITGCQLMLTVSSEEDPVNTDAQIMQVSGSVVDGYVNRFEFAFTSQDVDFVGESLYFDFQFTNEAGKTKTLRKGTWKMTQDITK
jgi:multidrug efflux pump subunit AcrB